MGPGVPAQPADGAEMPGSSIVQATACGLGWKSQPLMCGPSAGPQDCVLGQSLGPSSLLTEIHIRGHFKKKTSERGFWYKDIRRCMRVVLNQAVKICDLTKLRMDLKNSLHQNKLLERERERKKGKNLCEWSDTALCGHEWSGTALCGRGLGGQSWPAGHWLAGDM